VGGCFQYPLFLIRRERFLRSTPDFQVQQGSHLETRSPHKGSQGVKTYTNYTSQEQAEQDKPKDDAARNKPWYQGGRDYHEQAEHATKDCAEDSEGIASLN
jgi:hypothetical protein